jgi:hypothetical protein
MDAAYREWTRNRSDLDRLRRQEAISSYLKPDSAGVN